MPHVTFVPIKTIGLPLHKKIWTILFSFNRRIVLTEDYYHTFPDSSIGMLPAGFTSDGVSVPRTLFSVILIVAIDTYTPSIAYTMLACLLLVTAFGVMLVPGLFHDFEYRYKCILGKDKKPLHVLPSTRAQADDRFKRVNLQINDLLIFAVFGYILLRLGGWVAWNKHRKNDDTDKNNWRTLIH